MTSETTAKKNLQRLQRAIVDGLEDVKGQDIVVFNTEHLSPLFERVIVASGTSNRQTKALAASVRDAVRDAGFEKPRIEGEENGEWIIVDCGSAVAHVMQPVIRAYYRLEEIWGEKPLRLKHGAEKPAVAEPKPATRTSRKKPAVEAVAVPAKKVARKAAQATAKAAAAAPAKAASRPTTGTRPAATKVQKPASSKAATPAKTAKAPKPAPTASGSKAGSAGTAARKTVKTVVVKPRAASRPAAKSGAKAPAKTASRRSTPKKA
ncbi:MAG: ribosome silencing factor [Hydrogenophaga sp.]|jgi:ribosome-associated protein|nr:ribosome silencing factor [Hydrogenophaga sp.]